MAGKRDDLDALLLGSHAVDPPASTLACAGFDGRVVTLQDGSLSLRENGSAPLDSVLAVLIGSEGGCAVDPGSDAVGRVPGVTFTVRPAAAAAARRAARRPDRQLSAVLKVGALSPSSGQEPRKVP